MLRRWSLVLLAVVTIAAFVVACSGASTGLIRGSVTVGVPIAAAGEPVPAGLDPLLAFPPYSADLDLVPGELIVGFAPGMRALSLAPLAVTGVRLEAVRALAQADAALYRAGGLDQEQTRALAVELAAQPGIHYAHPNYLVRPLVVPDDEFYGLQWHYPAINLPAAWDLTTGSSDVVVAVVDTGILHSFADPARTHPEFVDKVVPGYDFISDPTLAGDGDGRDPDPYEIEGDLPGGVSSYHGSHVAGIIAARTDNATGVAGVDWEARLLPIRALGRGGGTVVDIVEGALWAAGFSVPGVPPNAHPAHVINLSLGGVRPCSPFEQAAFDRIAAESPRRAIVVAAAGNEAINAGSVSPAGCRNVITVGATQPDGDRAPYSNYGTRVDVMAPGGHMATSAADGVLSVARDDQLEVFGYAYKEGTSMAAPHVAGVIALMKDLDPTIDLGGALAALATTARPLTAEACARPSGNECGAGLVDAAAALAAVAAGGVAPPSVGTLVIDPSLLDLGAVDQATTLALRNDGTASVAWEIERFVPAPENPGEMLERSVLVSSLAGSLEAGAEASLTIAIDRERVTADGAYKFALVFEADGDEALVIVRFGVGDVSAPTLEGPMIVAAFVLDGNGDLVESGFVSADGFIADYAFAALPGNNLVVAWSDENGNDEVDAGDFIAVYPQPVLVRAGGTVSGIDLALEQVVSIEDGAPGTLQAAVDWERLLEALARRPR